MKSIFISVLMHTLFVRASRVDMERTNRVIAMARVSEMI